MNVTEPPAVFPALSVALALNVCGPRPNEYAGPFTLAHVVDATPESASVTIQYANGSVASILYSGLGPASMPKERVEVLRGGRSWVLDDFRTLTSFGADGTSEERDRGDKGHAELLRGVLAACRGERPFEPGLGAAYWAQSVALAALDSIASGQPMPVEAPPERAV